MPLQFLDKENTHPHTTTHRLMPLTSHRGLFFNSSFITPTSQLHENARTLKSTASGAQSDMGAAYDWNIDDATTTVYDGQPASVSSPVTKKHRIEETSADTHSAALFLDAADTCCNATTPPVDFYATEALRVASHRVSEMPTPSKVVICKLLARLWERLAESHRTFRRTSSHSCRHPAGINAFAIPTNYVIEHVNEWETCLRCSSASSGLGFGSTFPFDFCARDRRAAPSWNPDVFHVALSDDSERWVSSLFPNCEDRPSTQACNGSFADSNVAVEALMYRLFDCQSYLDKCLWPVAIALADRMHLNFHTRNDAAQANVHAGPLSSCQFPSVDGCGSFRFYRRHELRLLFTLFAIAFKSLSEYYIKLKLVVELLPQDIWQTPGGPNCSLLPRSLASRYPTLAERVMSISNPHSTTFRSPAYSVTHATLMERAVLVHGLGFNTHVSPSQIISLLDYFLSRSEGETLRTEIERDSVTRRFLI